MAALIKYPLVLLILFCSLVGIMSCNERNELDTLVHGDPQVVWCWSSDSSIILDNRLRSGESFSIHRATQLGTNLILNWNEHSILLNQYDDILLEEGMVQIFTHDFDNNGRDEIIVVAGVPVHLDWDVSVFEYSGGMLQPCGSVKSANDPIHIEGDEIWTPIGTQTGELYIYRQCDFYTLERVESD